MKNAVLLPLVSLLVACGGDSERIPLPFSNVVTDVELSLPPGTIGRGCEDGAVVGTVCFDPPIHPVGWVISMKVNGHDIALEDIKLTDGMLRTKGFGELEFQVSRMDPMTGRTFDILATRGQIRELEARVGSSATP